MFGKFALGSLFIEIRESTELVAQGLSDANKSRVIVTLAVGAWAMLLLVTRRVRVPDLLSGPGYWISMLIALFALSATWSVWLNFTLYRAFELFAAWIVVKHIFMQHRWREQIPKLCLLSIGFAWIGGLLYGGGREAGVDSLFGFRSNGASAVAAILLIYQYVEIRTGRSGKPGRQWMLAGFAALSLVAFGSLASQAGALAGLCVVAMLSAQEATRVSARVLLTGLALLGLVTAVSMPSFDLTNPLSFLANLFDRDARNVMSLTGRIPYWQGVWDVMKAEHFGLGFAAAERTIAIRLEEVLWNVGWATNAHSGYVSAWQSVGWPGLILVFVIFGSIWSNARRMARDERALIAGILVLLLLNNLTFNAVGGQLNTTFMIIMALASVPVAARGNRRNAGTARPQPLPAAGGRRPGLR